MAAKRTPPGSEAKVPVLTKPDCVIYSANNAGPQTHVLIVGVGHYPFFREGGSEADENAPLKQITSSTVSARTLAHWFINEYHYPPAPLGTVALLSSELNKLTFETAATHWILRAPDYAAFSVAAQAWFDRGNTDEGNRLIFVFCGHGFGYGQLTSLLMPDFDFRRLDAWDSALDLGKFIAGLASCAAAEQIYFIDACRRPHGDLLAPDAAIGRSPIHAKKDPRQHFSSKRNAPLIFSTGDDQPAHGRIDGISVFTAAFLKSVRGMAARDDNGDWRVNNYTLLEAMSHVSNRMTQQHFPESQQPQGAEARAFDFHYLRTDPVSPIYLDRGGAPCGPGDIHYLIGSKPSTRACLADELEIELELPFGEYRFTLEHGGTAVASAKARSAPTWKKASLT